MVSVSTISTALASAAPRKTSRLPVTQPTVATGDGYRLRLGRLRSQTRST